MMLKLLIIFICCYSEAYAINSAEYASVRRGAIFFVQYCSGCHSLRYMRPEQMARDLGNIIAFDLTKTSMIDRDAKRWFGQVPPDLSLEARVRGSHWLRDYCHNFYPDPNRPFGTNNRILFNVAMPNVFAPLERDVQTGGLSQKALDADIEDVINFLAYVAEPERLARYRLGFFVILFLSILAVILYLLQRAHPYSD
jgi:ubiquinol-cytochrome c reductase cytochrome c1 subunit